MNRESVYKRFLQHRRFVKVGQLLFEGRHIIESVSLVERLATYAMKNYPGFYTDGDMENLIASLAKHSITVGKRPEVSIGKKKLSVHVISGLASVGGKNRLLKEWVKRDKEHDHLVIITNGGVIPTGFSADCHFIMMEKEENILKKASLLRQHLQIADFIFLLHTPLDIISILALATEDIKAPVAIINHADHMFWTGSSVCDYLIEIRKSFLPIDQQRRQIENGGFLPIPVEPMNEFDTQQCRAALEITDEKVILLTVASAYKFDPIEPYDFFNDVIKILDRFPQTILFVVGMAEDDRLAIKHSQIKYMGIQDDVQLLKAACDIYMESYPFASFTSLLETAVNNKAYQLMYNPPLMSHMLSDEDDDKIIWNYPRNKQEWIDQLEMLILNKEFRNGEGVKRGDVIRKKHFINWQHYLEVIYKDVMTKTHKVRKIKPAIFKFGKDEEFLDSLLKNCYQMDIKYQMIAIPFFTRLHLCIRWLYRISSLKLNDLSFLIQFALGK